MYYFKHEFREFNQSDKMAYFGCENNLDGSSPVICEVYNDDTEVVVIISGDKESTSTIISMITGNAEYQIKHLGFNLQHIAIADCLVDYLTKDIENLEENIRGAISDFNMITLFHL